MSILNKKLYVQKTGGTAVACNIYSTLAEAGDKALRVRVDNTDGYIAIKATDDANATGMRVKSAALYTLLQQNMRTVAMSPRTCL